MPYYGDMRRYEPVLKARVSEGLLRLRADLKQHVPDRALRSTILLATWNIREFGGNKGGGRTPESLHYIAEILSAFDLIAVQEVRDLDDLKAVVRLLGPRWDYMVTDVTEGRAGNRERMAYVFDTRTVRFRNLVGEIVIPKAHLLADQRQFARTPFLAAFQAGWSKFNLVTVHMYFGDERGAKFDRRVEEIAYISEFLAKRSQKEGETYVALGDFNVVNPDDRTMTALESGGFRMLTDVPSNLGGDKWYDQIAVRAQRNEFKPTGRSGAYDFRAAVFRGVDEPVYADRLGRMRFKTWSTYQMSDHLPLWAELEVDFSDAYLEARLREATR